jgi:hypothetical protein
MAVVFACQPVVRPRARASWRISLSSDRAFSTACVELSCTRRQYSSPFCAARTCVHSTSERQRSGPRQTAHLIVPRVLAVLSEEEKRIVHLLTRALEMRVPPSKLAPRTHRELHLLFVLLEQFAVAVSGLHRATTSVRSAAPTQAPWPGRPPRAAAQAAATRCPRDRRSLLSARSTGRRRGCQRRSTAGGAGRHYPNGLLGLLHLLKHFAHRAPHSALHRVAMEAHSRTSPRPRVTSRRRAGGPWPCRSSKAHSGGAAESRRSGPDRTMLCARADSCGRLRKARQDKARHL